MIINDGICKWQRPFHVLRCQLVWFEGRQMLLLSLNESGKLLQWLCRDDSTVSIVIIIIIIIIIMLLQLG